jgi:hypothetical protein
MAGEGIMTSPVDSYTTELSNQFHYVATWTPGTVIRLGDIGELDGHEFVPKSSIRSLGVKFSSTKASQPGSWDYQSSGSVSMAFKAKGQLSPDIPSIPKGKAGIGIRFGREGATVVHAEGVASNRVADILGLEKAMWDLWDRGIWQEGWALVTEVVTAARATILLSASSDGKVELEAMASASVPVGRASLEGSLSIAFSQGMHTTFVNDAGLTPFFRAVRIKDSLLRGPHKEPVKGEARAVRRPAAGEPARRGWPQPPGRLTEVIERT